MASTAASTFVQSLSSRKALKGTELKSQTKVAPVAKVVTIKASSDEKVELGRRSALSVLTAGAVSLAAKPSYAAYGQGANVFGKTTNTSGFYSYAGDGYALLVPSNFNPSKEREFPGADARWEDNYRVANCLIVTRNPTSKAKIEDYGAVEDFIQTEAVTGMLGANSWGKETGSEGGFEANTISSAALLGTGTSTRKGKTYYEAEFLVRTADGDEGGRHALFSATVSNGQLYVAKIQSGDKSWFKGGERYSREVINSFLAV